MNMYIYIYIPNIYYTGQIYDCIAHLPMYKTAMSWFCYQKLWNMDWAWNIIYQHMIAIIALKEKNIFTKIAPMISWFTTKSKCLEE